MPEIPTTLVHFFRSPGGPFRSISELPVPEADRIMDGMTEGNTWHASRFRPENRERYLRARQRSERHLHEAFVAKGGRPGRAHPYYLLVETAETRGFWPDASQIRVPLNGIPAEVISFTYLDSMVCDALRHDPERVPENCRHFAGWPCLAEVYRVAELRELIESFGCPEGTYLEAQVWADEPLEAYR